MNTLYIETSSKNCSVTIANAHEILCVCEQVSENYKQSESLHNFVEWALEGAELSMNDIQAVCLGKGPGSYTGLRIGAAAAKGFCYGLKIPLVAINSMESMVQPFLGQGYDLIVPLLDARRMEVYTASYDGVTGEEVSGTEALILDDNAFKNLEGKKVLFVGDGALKSKEIISISNAEFKEDVYPSSKYLVEKGRVAIQNQDFEDVAYFEPYYLKDFHGVKKKKSEE